MCSVCKENVELRTKNFYYLWTLHFCIAIDAEVKRSLTRRSIAITRRRNGDFLQKEKCFLQFVLHILIFSYHRVRS